MVHSSSRTRDTFCTRPGVSWAAVWGAHGPTSESPGLPAKGGMGARLTPRVRSGGQQDGMSSQAKSKPPKQPPEQCATRPKPTRLSKLATRDELNRPLSETPNLTSQPLSNSEVKAHGNANTHTCDQRPVTKPAPTFSSRCPDNCWLAARCTGLSRSTVTRGGHTRIMPQATRLGGQATPVQMNTDRRGMARKRRGPGGHARAGTNATQGARRPHKGVHREGHRTTP